MSKKDKKSKEEKESKKNKSSKKKAKKLKKRNVSSDSSEPHTLSFEIPSKRHVSFPAPPPFLIDLMNNLQQQVGGDFHTVNIRVVNESELDTLPNNILEQILTKAVSDESYDLASKIRDIIKNRENGK